MKIQFYQLPTPLINNENIRENSMNSAGYLVSYFKSKHKNSNYDFVITESEINDHYGDAALINHIKNTKPEIICFTCYCWNAGRTKYISKKIKECMPNIKIIYGGPEITIDNDFLLSENYADFMVAGEGEQLFEKLMMSNLRLNQTEKGYIFKKKDSKYFFNGYADPIKKLEFIPSPYLSGILTPEKNGFMRFETQRGCSCKCSYCYYGKEFGTKRMHDSEYISKLFKYAVKNGVSEIFLLDPDFLNRKDILSLLNIIIKINSGKSQVELHTELNAELVTEEIAVLLKSANFKSAEIGLQSVNTEKLKVIGRKNNITKIINGINLLKSNGINTIVDIIIGLPGETVSDVRKTLEFIKKEGLNQDAQAFNLALLPGTKLRADSKKYSIEYMFEPPYYCLKTKNLQTSELISLFDEAENLFNVEFDPVELPSFIDHQKKSNFPEKETMLFDKIIIDFSKSENNSESKIFFKKSFDLYKTKISNNFCLWIKNHTQFFSGIISDFIKELTEINPHTVFDFIIEPSESYDFTSIKNLFEKEILNYSHYLNNYYYFNFGGSYLISSKKIVLLKELIYDKYYKFINKNDDNFYYIPVIENYSGIERLKKYLTRHQDILIKTNKLNKNQLFLNNLKQTYNKYAELIHFNDEEIQFKWENLIYSDNNKKKIETIAII